MSNEEDPYWVQAGDNTLHGAIDYWQAQAARLQIELDDERERRKKAQEQLYQCQDDRKRGK